LLLHSASFAAHQSALTLTQAHFAILYAGFSAADVRVIYGGKQLEGDCALAEAGVREAATLDVLGRLLGAGKKRKKKV
jgi:hypothetical protein